LWFRVARFQFLFPPSNVDCPDRLVGGLPAASAIIAISCDHKGDGFMKVCYRCIVSGRVQGVFFRASTQREARQLGVTGHAINLPDGCVEVLACGEANAVEQFRDWLWLGPPASRVARVDCQSVETVAPASFTTG